MIEKRPLYINFLWHMHQPFYKDLVTGEYILPWVRLHAIKDYYDMAKIIENFPNLFITFNLVPSLLVQLNDYIQGEAKDRFLDCSQKPAQDLQEDEKIFILQNFFLCNWQTMIKPYPHYFNLLMRRGQFISLQSLRDIQRKFTSQDFLDLQVWFNLSWFGYFTKTNDQEIRELINKGKNFSEEEKNLILKKQIELMKLIIPLYKNLMENGKIEITTSPFYHPILPLLCNPQSAKEALPSITLPKNLDKLRSDALAQIKKANEFYQQLFGRKTKGMWPAEGSVGNEIIPILADEGIRWIATDEDILAYSLKKKVTEGSSGRALLPTELYKPYKVVKDNKEMTVIFRDRYISDLIGFVYWQWNSKEAVNDLINRLRHIRDTLPDDGRNYLVSIILDGENAWEYYRNNGWDFLWYLYEKLNYEPTLKTTTVSKFLENNPPRDSLEHLFAGSWINHNFSIWIGQEEDNKAWEALDACRRQLMEINKNNNIDIPPENINLAWEEIYIAEGSDWFWWFGKDHSSANDPEFDALFRKHLINVYDLIGKNVPDYLTIPIKEIGFAKPQKEPVYLIKPILDGMITNYYEWINAGHFEIFGGRGAMHQSETLIKDIYYGFDLENLYLRIDGKTNLIEEFQKGMCFCVQFLKPENMRLELYYEVDPDSPLSETKISQFHLLRKKNGENWEIEKKLNCFAIGKIIELGVPFSDLNINSGETVEFTLIICKNKLELGRFPEGLVKVKRPEKDYDAQMWYV